MGSTYIMSDGFFFCTTLRHSRPIHPADTLAVPETPIGNDSICSGVAVGAGRVKIGTSFMPRDQEQCSRSSSLVAVLPRRPRSLVVLLVFPTMDVSAETT